MTTSEVTPRKYVEFLFDDSGTREEETDSIDPTRAKNFAMLEERVVGFRTYMRLEQTVEYENQSVTLRSEPIHESGQFWINARKLSPKEAKVEFGDTVYQTARNCGAVIVTRFGRVQPWHKEDAVI